MDLKPDKYYARIVIDTNGNGVWDTGNYIEKRQPEEVYYSPKMYEIMQNWQVEETWNVNSTPLAKQKPLEITKNKPKEATKKKRNYKDESQQSSSRNNSGGNMGKPCVRKRRKSQSATGSAPARKCSMSYTSNGAF